MSDYQRWDLEVMKAFTDGFEEALKEMSGVLCDIRKAGWDAAADILEGRLRVLRMEKIEGDPMSEDTPIACRVCGTSGWEQEADSGRWVWLELGRSEKEESEGDPMSKHGDYRGPITMQNMDEIAAWCDGAVYSTGKIGILTKEAVMRAEVGDYVICMNGKFYPQKPDEVPF